MKSKRFAHGWARRVTRPLVAALMLPLGCLSISSAAAQVTMVSVSSVELSAAKAERVTYAVRTGQPGSLTLELLTGDGDLVRSLPVGNVGPGLHTAEWDGRDQRGQAVPDEAYCARAVLTTDQGRLTDDPCTRTGGEFLEKLQASMMPGGDIAYSLEHPARVMVRVGIKGGPMLRSLSVWRPRSAGRNLQRWNGFDESGLIDLRSERLALLVVAFRLPDFTVIVTGNPDVDYRAWRIAQGWPELAESARGAGEQPLLRNGQRIARQHYTARYKDREPRISVVVSGANGKPLEEGAALPTNARVSVDIHREDRWLMQEQLYEVAFFVNGEFVSEEENGYVPIAWIWNTASLQPGRHLLTVNLTGFAGRVGSQTLAVTKK